MACRDAFVDVVVGAACGAPPFFVLTQTHRATGALRHAQLPHVTAVTLVNMLLGCTLRVFVTKWQR